MRQSLCTPFSLLILVSLGLGSLSTAVAHPYSPKREFFHLKKSADWFNYVEVQSYVEVVGTKFIGLEAAYNSKRTCLYGFSQANLEGPGTYEVQARFVCFNTDRYQLAMKKDYCIEGTEGCEVDPGGISVGIGNLDVVEPTGLGGELPFPKPGNFYKDYPEIVSVDVYKPLRFPLKGLNGDLPKFGLEQ